MLAGVGLCATLIHMETLTRCWHGLYSALHRGRRWSGWLLAGALCVQCAAAQSVTFINPGKSDEAYWVASAQAMQRAADDLGMQLDIIYTQRDRLRPIVEAQRIAALPAAKRPDYVVFSNEYSVAPSMLEALKDSGIQVFMAFSGVQGVQREKTGGPREHYPLWLGSMIPNAEEAGYLTAQAVIAAARSRGAMDVGSGKLHMLAIAGDRSTPSSIARNAGMRKAVAQSSDVVLEQEVYGEWSRDKAFGQASVLFQRYPQARVVWAGNDLMAFGAMQAWKQRGGEPGQDAFFSGINTSEEAFNAVREGRLSALAGGHFLAGAWAMVMLFDHSRGIDFVQEGLELQRPMFMLLDPPRLDIFEASFGVQGRALNFRQFSKYHNKKLRHYDFDMKHLLR